MGLFFQAWASRAGSANAPRRPERLAQFAATAGHGIAVQAGDACQQADAAFAVLPGEKAREQAPQAFVRSNDETVESTMLSCHSSFGMLLAGLALTNMDAPSRFPLGRTLLLGHWTFTSLRAHCQRPNVILYLHCGSNFWTLTYLVMHLKQATEYYLLVEVTPGVENTNPQSYEVTIRRRFWGLEARVKVVTVQ